VVFFGALFLVKFVLKRLSKFVITERYCNGSRLKYQRLSLTCGWYKFTKYGW